jgi:putative transposase
MNENIRDKKLGEFVMAGTFSKIHIQLVFAVQGRENIIVNPWREKLYQYISGIIRKKNQKLLIINGMPDHLHLFIGLRPATALSDLVRDIKNASTNVINLNKWVKGAFRWQEGYGAFSYGYSQIDTVCKYIANQPIHHKKRTFRDEYLDLLTKFNIPFEERFLFQWLDYSIF